MNSYSLFIFNSVVLKVIYNFTDKHGEFVFGPLCPGKEYALEIFVNDVKHVKICAKGKKPDSKCLKGIKMDECDKKIGLDEDYKL